jgi:serine/threonine protein kinase
MDEIFGIKYVLGPELGEGGMARVFRGTIQGTDSLVAVKIVRNEISEHHPEIAEVFLRNRQVLTSINHTNLVKVIDVVEEGDTLGIVMELIDGESLGNRLRRVGKLPLEAGLPLFKQIMLGLGELHASGITHGDIKPDNILLDSSTGSTLVKITDFGLADVQRATVPDNFIFGTLEYMAPEVASGAITGPPADMYSAGILLYEMLAGDVPFVGGTPVLIHKHQNEDPPPIAELAGDDSRIWTLLGRLLAKDPTKRPSAFAILAELEDTPWRITAHLEDSLMGDDPGEFQTHPPSNRHTTRLSFRRPKSGFGVRPTAGYQPPPSSYPPPPSYLPPVPYQPSSSVWPMADEPLPAAQPDSDLLDFQKRLKSITPIGQMREEEIHHEEGSLHRFDLGSDEFLIVDRMDGNGTVNWTTSITPSDFVNLIASYLEEGADEGRMIIGLKGIMDEVDAEFGVMLSRMGGSLFDRDCEFLRFDRGDLTLAYQVLPGYGSILPAYGSNGRTYALGISAPHLTVGSVLPLLVLTGSRQVVAHALSTRTDALPSLLGMVLASQEGPGSSPQALESADSNLRIGDDDSET